MGVRLRQPGVRGSSGEQEKGKRDGGASAGGRGHVGGGRVQWSRLIFPRVYSRTEATPVTDEGYHSWRLWCSLHVSVGAGRWEVSSFERRSSPMMCSPAQNRWVERRAI